MFCNFNKVILNEYQAYFTEYLLAPAYAYMVTWEY